MNNSIKLSDLLRDDQEKSGFQWEEEILETYVLSDNKAKIDILIESAKAREPERFNSGIYGMHKIGLIGYLMLLAIKGDKSEILIWLVQERGGNLKKLGKYLHTQRQIFFRREELKKAQIKIKLEAEKNLYAEQMKSSFSSSLKKLLEEFNLHKIMAFAKENVFIHHDMMAQERHLNNKTFCSIYRAVNIRIFFDLGHKRRV